MAVIILENNDNERPNVERQPLNPTNVFDIKSILTELAPYDLVITTKPIRRERNGLVAIPLVAAYKGLGVSKDVDKDAALVYLYVDYAEQTAYAMSKSGADKQSMLLIASVANKHIREPFKFSKLIRNKVWR